MVYADTKDSISISLISSYFDFYAFAAASFTLTRVYMRSTMMTLTNVLADMAHVTLRWSVFVIVGFV